MIQGSQDNHPQDERTGLDQYKKDHIWSKTHDKKVGRPEPRSWMSY